MLGRLIWGTDTSTFYRDIARLGEEPDGTVILDVPCGGGVAFRGLRPGQRVRYVAADLSPVMLRRARPRLSAATSIKIDFIEADVEALPFEDASFDLCVSYTGLHCFPDPAAAVCEIGRVLRPGAVVRGSMVVRRAGLRQDAFVRLYQAAGVFGPTGTSDEMASWLADAGMLDVSTRSDGALAYFSARRNPEHASSG